MIRWIEVEKEIKEAYTKDRIFSIAEIAMLRNLLMEMKTEVATDECQRLWRFCSEHAKLFHAYHECLDMLIIIMAKWAANTTSDFECDPRDIKSDANLYVPLTREFEQLHDNKQEKE